jgi:hypothetical protein
VGEAVGNGRHLEGGRLTRRSKVGERPDGRAPPVGVWHEKEKGASELGRRGNGAGPAWAGQHAREDEADGLG